MIQEAGVVPYVDYHNGPRRVLILTMRPGNSLTHAGSHMTPIASIDGRQYIVYWGTVNFEIPADRACHISVHLEAEYIVQAASTLLPPGDGPVTLQYSAEATGVAKLQ